VLIGKCRAWQRKLYAVVQDADNRAELYKYLWLLMTSSDPPVFQQHLHDFLVTWKDKEPKFMEYFQSTYVSRAGICIANHAH